MSTCPISRLASTGVTAVLGALACFSCVSCSSSKRSGVPDGGYNFGDGSGLDVGTQDTGRKPDANPLPHDGGHGASDGAVTSGDTGNSTDAGAPCKGCSVLTDGVENPQSIALDFTNVYWTQGTSGAGGVPVTGGGSVRGVKRIGGSISIVASVLTGPLMLKVSDVDPRAPIYAWSELGPAAGAGSVTNEEFGPPKVAGMNLTSPFGVALDGANVYWGCSASGASIQAAPLVGGPVTTLGVVAGSAVPFGMAVNATSIYFAAQSSVGGGLFELPIAAVDGGTAPKELWTGDAASLPVDVAIDATNVYWTDAGDGAVYAMPLGGGTVSTMASKASGLVAPKRIAVDSKNVYFSDTAGSALYEVAIGGTTPKVLVKGLGVLGVAADDNDANVYFSSATQVLSVAK